MPTDRFWILIARKLSGESSVEENRELEELLKQHPNLHFSVEIISNLWKQRTKKDQGLLENSYHEHIERMNNFGISLNQDVDNDQQANGSYLLLGSRKKKFGKQLVIAATMIMIAGATFLVFRTGKKVPTKKDDVVGLAVSTKYGSRTNMQLPDGSKVWLNSGSTLTYDKQFGKDIREVTLSGEAYFDVVKNPEMPFIIHTSSMDIKVLGTEFNVKSYANDELSEASLIHGSIEVTLKKRRAEKIILKPREKIVVMNEEPVKTGAAEKIKNTLSEPLFAVKNLNYADSSIVETSWVENKLIFRNESFEDIALKMQRWYGIDVEFDNPSVKDEHLNGSFTNETIEQALDALQLIAKFKYEIKDHKVIITK